MFASEDAVANTVRGAWMTACTNTRDLHTVRGQRGQQQEDDAAAAARR